MSVGHKALYSGVKGRFSYLGWLSILRFMPRGVIITCGRPERISADNFTPAFA